MRQAEAKRLAEAAQLQDEEAAELASRALALEAEGRLADAKALARAARHRRVESLKAKAIASAHTRRAPKAL